VATVLRRLSHTLDVLDDFDANRQAMMIWLMSLKDTLNECEHLKGYSSSNVVQVRANNPVLDLVKLTLCFEAYAGHAFPNCLSLLQNISQFINTKKGKEMLLQDYGE